MSNSPSVSQILYDRFAAGNAGFLNPDDFGKICYSLGSYLSPNEIAVAFALIDGDGDGQINREGKAHSHPTLLLYTHTHMRCKTEFLKFWNEDKRFERLQLE